MTESSKRVITGCKLIAASLCVIGTLLLLFDHQLYHLKTKLILSQNWSDTLRVIALNARKGDLPISAILVYKDSIIGYGYNTIRADRNLAGHADINALNMAFGSYRDDFYELDREELVLYTTSEPCQMCKGIFVNQNIKNVMFDRKKEFRFQLKKRFHSIRFEFYKRQMKMDILQ